MCLSMSVKLCWDEVNPHCVHLCGSEVVSELIEVLVNS